MNEITTVGLDLAKRVVVAVRRGCEWPPPGAPLQGRVRERYGTATTPRTPALSTAALTKPVAFNSSTTFRT